ncbi:MAG: response regulator [Chloroflexota bacterium]|nr:response regulator [Chloroflexota bacterium]
MSEASLKPERIAVIDDDTVFLELMHDLLGLGEGYQVFSSADSLGCVEFIERVSADLVILDLMLGGQDTGWTVLDLLRSHPSTRELPVIVCSAATPALEAKAPQLQALGHVSCISKPFDLEQLVATVERMLAWSRAAIA